MNEKVFYRGLYLCSNAELNLYVKLVYLKGDISKLTFIRQINNVHYEWQRDGLITEKANVNDFNGYGLRVPVSYSSIIPAILFLANFSISPNENETAMTK